MPGTVKCGQEWWASCGLLCKGSDNKPSPPPRRPEHPASLEQDPVPKSKDEQNTVLEMDTLPALDHFSPLEVHPDFRVFDLKVYENGGVKQGLQQYHRLCREQQGLLVTTSCFATWLKARKTNGGAKLIPAIPADCGGLAGPGEGQALRVFFFDDNINLHLGGSCSIDGICNLRDVLTGAYVDFSSGENGFQADCIYRHTVVQHSSMYRNVLVQANILDAMANRDYFSAIIKRYAQPGEKLVVFFDVNGTLLWDDTVSDRGMSEVLLSTMFRFAEVRPRSACDFTWEGQPPVHLEQRMTLRHLVSEISHKDSEFYAKFWSFENCNRLLHEIEAVADFGWLNDRSCLTSGCFFYQYQEYMDEMRQHVSVDGITSSWFEVWEQLRDSGHVVVLNSFGVDTHRVVARSVPDERAVLYITIDYSLWGPKDTMKWSAQFQRPARAQAAVAS